MSIPFMPRWNWAQLHERKIVPNFISLGFVLPFFLFLCSSVHAIFSLALTQPKFRNNMPNFWNNFCSHIWPDICIITWEILCVKVEINGKLKLLEKYYLDYLYFLDNKSCYNLHFKHFISCYCWLECSTCSEISGPLSIFRKNEFSACISHNSSDIL